MTDRPRGFAAMSPERRRELAARGGTVAHKLGNAHRFTSKEARLAGRKGGSSPRTKKAKPNSDP